MARGKGWWKLVLAVLIGVLLLYVGSGIVNVWRATREVEALRQENERWWIQLPWPPRPPSFFGRMWECRRRFWKPWK